MKIALRLMLAYCAAAGQSLPPALAELFNKGVQAEKAGRLDAAEKAFRDVLEQGGKRAFVYNNLGLIYYERGDYGRALAQFGEAIRLDPKYAAPRVLKGTSLLALGRLQEATVELEGAVNIDPREPTARLELARAYERAGDFAGAVEQFRTVRELAPRDSEYAYQLGHTYMKLSDWCIRKIVRIAPDSARVHQMLAENRDAQGRTGEAVREYLKAAAADPKLAGIHLALAQIHLQEGKLDEARVEIERELAIVPESAMALELKRKLDSTRP